MAHKGTSQKVSRIASRVMRNHNPVRSDEKLRDQLWDHLRGDVEPITDLESAMGMPGVLDEKEIALNAIALALDPYFKDMKTLAASALAQDDVKGG